MDYKRNIKYYNSNDRHFYVGVIIMGVAAVFFAISNILGLHFMPMQTPLCLGIALVGAVVAFAPASGRASENEIDEAVLRATQKYDEETLESVHITLSRRIKPALLGNFVYDGEGVIARRGRAVRKYRSSKYTVAALLFTNDGVYISQKTFSLIADEKNETEMQFAFEDMDSVYTVCEERVFDEKYNTKIWFFVISEGGKEALRIPVKYNASVDSLCESVNRAIAEAKAKA